MTRVTALIAVLVAVSACEQRDPLFCDKHMDDPRCTFGDGRLPDGYVVISGTVTNLNGSGLVLLDNGGDDKQIASSGPFSFAMPVLEGSSYDVTVGTQPTNPSEMCVVNNGSGIASSGGTEVEVLCMPAAYEVGGNVAGFTTGGNIVVTNNGGDDKTITANGMFTFATPVPSGQPYDVAIKSQQGETCSIVANMGIVGSGPVSTVVVVCGSNLFTIGGATPFGGVSGLRGSVQLHNASTNDTITVATNGDFAFPTPVMGGGTQTYNVTVSQQPAYPPAAQNCTVTNATGNVGNQNITNIGVACATRSFTIGGNVSGLTGTVVLKNGADTKSVSANGPFMFNTAVASGLTYAVSVMTQPAGEICTVTMGSGTVANGDITTVAVSCVDAGVRCANAYCGSGMSCCDPEGSATCIASATTCATIKLPCDDRADCGSTNYCCAQRHTGTLVLDAVTCESACTNVTNGLQLCDPAANECVTGTCQAWTDLPGYYACQ